MIVKHSKDFLSCPDYSGPAVCVDVTPLEKTLTDFGERETFHLVFEVNLIDESDPNEKRYCVWSKRLTPSLHEKANLRKILKQWFGRDLTAEELAGFDLEQLVGRPANLTVIQEQKDDKVFANIALYQPHKTGEPLTPSGKFVRKQNRPAKDEGHGDYKRTQAQPKAAPTPTPAQPQATAAAGASMPATPAAPSAVAAGAEFGKLKVHLGPFKGIALEDMAMDQIQRLTDGWLPKAKALPKPTADDKRLIAALEYFAAQAKPAETTPDDLTY